MRTIPVFCGKDCGGKACPLLATIEDGRVVRIANNPAGGKYLTGCARGFNLAKELYASERLLKPLIRTGDRGSGAFREASWDEALALVAARLGDIRSIYGNSSILNLASAGQTSALHGTQSLLARFLNLGGGATTLSSNYSNGAARFALPYVLGSDWTRSGFDASTMRYSEMIILWGANVLEARLGTEVDRRLVEAKERGARIVAIDPRRSTTIKRLGARWLPIRPGTDAALMLAVLHVLFAEGLADRSCIEKYSVGFNRLEDYVMGKAGGEVRSPRWASGVCGLDEETIIDFAREYPTAKPSLLFPGYSIQRVYAGEDVFRLTVALQLATGNFGLLGGSTGSLNNRQATPKVGILSVPALPSQPSVPVVRWPDLVLEGKAGDYPSDIRAIYSIGGNFLNQGCDARKGVAAFKKVDFIASHELFMTPTARYSDVVLPAAHSLEKEDIGIPWDGNFLSYKARAVPPAGESRTDYDILADLAERMGFGGEFTEERDADAWLRRFLDESEIEDIDEFRRTGVYFGRERDRTGLAAFVSDPVGKPLSTPSGKVEISSEKYHAETGFPEIPMWRETPADPRYPLALLTPKSPYRTHSQGHGVAELRAKVSHALSMHPTDAAVRGLSDGDTVRVFNDRGALRVALRFDEDISTGTVCLSEGVWFDLDASGEDCAGSANMLTSTEGTMPAIANVMHGIRVQVEFSVQDSDK
ncbi:MAG: molybdopterin-dependent oxidoreductase [Acidobacteriota bacterium]